MDQAVGFGTFANGGVAHAGYLVQEVTDAGGHVLYKHKDAGQRAMDPRVANDVSLTLEPIAGSSGVPLADGRPSAAKTGTEGIGPNTAGNSDAWMVGYTPQVSTAVWVGSGDSTHPVYDANGNPEYGRDLPGKTWKLFMDSYLSGQPAVPMPTTQQIFGGTDVPSTPPPSTHSQPTTPVPPSTPPPSTSHPSTSVSLLPPITLSSPTSPTPSPPPSTRTRTPTPSP